MAYIQHVMFVLENLESHKAIKYIQMPYIIQQTISKLEFVMIIFKNFEFDFNSLTNLQCQQ